MKIYSTASSKGVVKNKQICRQIVKIIEKSGHQLSLDWIKLATDPSEPLKGRPADPVNIFKENLTSLTKSSACIFETSDSSWGLVYQITYSITKEIPTLCLFNTKKSPSDLSNMLPGIKSKYLFIEKYSTDTLEEIIKKFLFRVEKSNLVKFNFIVTQEIKDYIEWAANKNNMSQSEFLREEIKSKIIAKDNEFKNTVL